MLENNVPSLYTAAKSMSHVEWERITQALASVTWCGNNRWHEGESDSKANVRLGLVGVTIAAVEKQLVLNIIVCV